jgi:hypothetical protein
MCNSIRLRGADLKIIYARHGEEILVDDEDYEELIRHKWHVSSKGYATTWCPTKDGKDGVERMHRMVLGLQRGDPRQGDHIDHTKKLDNRRSNLRIATRSENQMNRGRPRRGNNPYKGVTRSTHGDKWVGQIVANGKRYHLGTFSTPEAAHEAYKRAAIELHGEFANIGA